MAMQDLLPGIVRSKDAAIVQCGDLTIMLDVGQIRVFDKDGINIGEPHPATYLEKEMITRIVRMQTILHDAFQIKTE